MNGIAFMKACQRLELPVAQLPVIIVLSTSMKASELAREKVTSLLQQHFNNN